MSPDLVEKIYSAPDIPGWFVFGLLWIAWEAVKTFKLQKVSTSDANFKQLHSDIQLLRKEMLAQTGDERFAMLVIGDIRDCLNELTRLNQKTVSAVETIATRQNEIKKKIENL